MVGFLPAMSSMQSVLKPVRSALPKEMRLRGALSFVCC